MLNNTMIITYADYLLGIGEKVIYNEEKYTEKEFDEWYKGINEKTPDWFKRCQDIACNIIRKNLAQAHLFPRTRQDFLDLRPDFWIEQGTGIAHQEAYNFQEMVRDAIANQIQFVHENDVYYYNGYLNTTATFTIGTYTNGQQDTFKIFNKMHPVTYDYFQAIGWTYSSLDYRLHADLFYKGEK